jgi:cell division protein FtsQ
VSQLDAGGAHYAQGLSEVDVSDGEDVKVIANDPQGEVLVHLGSANYLERYKVYESHVREWRQQFDRLESVDLRYDRQIIVNPDLQGAVKPAPVSKSSANAALAAGMKPAALITHEVTATKPTAPAALAAKAPAEVSAEKKTIKKIRRKAARKVRPKSGAAAAPNKSLAKIGPPATQAASPLATPAPATSGKTMPAAPPVTGTGAVKPGSKPSPAIAKGEEQP